jgi:membrane protein implicated in regulation of membrane protease activity
VEFKGTTWNAECDTKITEGQPVIIIRKSSFNLIVKPKQ